MTADMGLSPDETIVTAHVRKIQPSNLAAFKERAVWIADVKLYLTQAQYETISTKGTQLRLKIV